MADDIARAAALLVAASMKDAGLTEVDAFRAWRRHRARLASQISAAAAAARQGTAQSDDSAVFTPEGDGEQFDWSGDEGVSDDSLDVRFPSGRPG